MFREKNIVIVPSTIDRILGEEASVLQKEVTSISNFIEAEFLMLDMTGKKLSDEEGRLLLYPIADGQYNLQLCYFIPQSNSFYTRVCRITFSPQFFDQFSAETLSTSTPFRFDQTTEQQFSICIRTRSLLDQLEDTAAVTSLLQSLQQTETAVQLLRRALENVTLPFAACQVPACRFLNNESEREKIMEARRILEQHVDQPITIRELSRRVAMNECYLKKGFKTLTGKTINEFQQEQRIAKAKELLQQKGQTVSEVASLLGYSSISHFSTAFKKATGLKPCELLG